MKWKPTRLSQEYNLPRRTQVSCAKSNLCSEHRRHRAAVAVTVPGKMIFYFSSDCVWRYSSCLQQLHGACLNAVLATFTECWPKYWERSQIVPVWRMCLLFWLEVVLSHTLWKMWCFHIRLYPCLSTLCLCENFLFVQERCMWYFHIITSNCYTSACNLMVAIKTAIVMECWFMLSIVILIVVKIRPAISLLLYVVLLV